MTTPRTDADGVLRYRMKRVEVQRIRDGGVTYVQYLVPCGKRNCTKCPHGPYWYAFLWHRGRVRERYVGKDLVSTAGALATLSEERRGRLRAAEDLLDGAEVRRDGQ